MASDRRINLRFTEKLFARLDKKRRADQTTFQAVGSRLFMEWAEGARSAVVPADLTEQEAAMVRALVLFLRTNKTPGLLRVLESVLLPNIEGKTSNAGNG